MERHNTDHDTDDHSNPHDHVITWEGNHPNWGDHIDYPEGMAPDFENMFGGGKAYMKGKRVIYSELTFFAGIRQGGIVIRRNI